MPHPLVLAFVDELTTWVPYPPRFRRVGGDDACDSWVESCLVMPGPLEASDGFTALRNRLEFIEENHKQDQKREPSETLSQPPKTAELGAPSSW